MERQSHVTQARGDLVLVDKIVGLRHGHDDGEDGVTLAFREIRRDRGHRLRVGLEHARIVHHVVAQQVVRREHVHEHLLGAAGDELAKRLVHVGIFVLHHDEAVLLLGNRPQVAVPLEPPVELKLFLGQLGKREQVAVVLPVYPALVGQGNGAARRPGHLRDLALQRHQADLGAHAQVLRHARHQPMLQVLAIDVPHHVDGGAFGILGSRDLGEVHAQRMGKRVHQPVAVVVEHAVGGGCARGEVFGEVVQTDLIRSEQARGVDDDYEAHLFEEIGMFDDVAHVAQRRERHDGHIAGRLDPQVHGSAHAPHVRDAGGKRQTLFHVFGEPLCRSPRAVEHERTLVAHELGVEWQEDIGDEIAVKRRGEDHAFPAQHADAFEREVVVERPVLGGPLVGAQNATGHERAEIATGQARLVVFGRHELGAEIVVRARRLAGGTPRA